MVKKLLYCQKDHVKVLSYKQKSKSIEFLDVRACPFEELNQCVSKNDIVSVAIDCNIYTDKGVFPSVSRLATSVSIKNSVTNFGAFATDFEISFKKINPIDKTKAEFFYVAVSKEDLNCVNQLNCIVEKAIPTEIAIANLFRNYYKNEHGFIVAYERNDFLKVICFNRVSLLATKTIQKEGFGTELEETAELILSYSRQHNIKNVYLALNDASIDLADMQVKPIEISIGSFDLSSALENIELLGLLYKSDINFLSASQKENLEIYQHIQIAKTIAFVVIFLSACIFAISSANYIRLIDKREQLINLKASYEQSLNSIKLPQKLLEDPAKLQQNIDSYIKLSQSPHISDLLANIANQRIGNLYLLSAEFINTNANQNAKNIQNVQNATSNQTINAAFYTIELKGVVFGNLDETKVAYNEFLKNLSKHFKIDLSNMYYMQNKLFFDLKIEERNDSSA